ncbi:SagB family peptide dehydrogenase [Paenibacillus puerhi]|uniref:SagB family peptide dehydrogenase n=1 Tax=Paenibacillus puerhi TaxID=2692622 RepID=UPI0013593E99|nr:SagB family peptide dehydrogenase [Paenibacillus puerhi]
MSLDAFLHDLHHDIDKTKPPGLEVDWEDGPLAYKLYRGLSVIPLAAEVPLTLEGMEGHAKRQPDLRAMGHFLWYVYGLTQWSQSVPVTTIVPGMTVLQSYRRFVPSGGALYPNEVYVYLKLADLPAGVYHYDVAHHRLVLLREGDFDSYIARALGNRCDVSACFGAVFVTTFFWKNFFKYHYFSYRLQGLDAGALIGQLLEVSKRFGFEPGVYVRFLDRALNELLGVSEQEESVYAVIPLSVNPAMTWFAHVDNEAGRDSAEGLRGELPPVQHDHYVRSRRVKEFPLLLQMHEASLDETLRPLQPIRGARIAHGEDQTIALPGVKRLAFDLASVCRQRFSPDADFVRGKVTQEQLALLLQEATASCSYRNDLDETAESPVPRVFLYVCLYQVEGIPDGAYRYDSEAHALQRVRDGDHRFLLQQGMSLDNVNLFQVPLCFHVAGDQDHLKAALGFRGYRIQQMEAGMLVQRLLLAAAAIGMGGHPLLGFDVGLSDELYRMTSQGLTSLIQIPVGPHRPCPRLQGGLHG